MVFPLFVSPLHVLPCRRALSVKETRRPKFRANMKSPQDPIKPRFMRDDNNPAVKPKESFFEETAKQQSPLSPNDRLLKQVRKTMSTLGVEEEKELGPESYVPIDISNVNPFSALLGATGAAAISYTMWTGLGYISLFFVQHPLDYNLYVVQRLGAVVRTALISIFALGSGISGVTSLGLFMLSVRTTYGSVTGEWDSSKDLK